MINITPLKSHKVPYAKHIITFIKQEAAFYIIYKVKYVNKIYKYYCRHLRVSYIIYIPIDILQLKLHLQSELWNQY